MNSFFKTSRQNQGFSLVELMIAMMLGLFLIGGVISVFLSNREVYRQNENLARMQENARYTFEVVGRSVREAAGIPCGSNMPTANVLNNPTANWWSNWGDGIHGYDGGASDGTGKQALPDPDPGFATGTETETEKITKRVVGTDAFIIYSSTDNNGVVVTEHTPAAAQFKVNTTAHGFVQGDIVLVCDYKQAAILQITSASTSNVTVVHNTGNTVDPGNCSKGLGYPTVCTATGTPYTFESGGFMTKLSSNAWYIGYNGRGGTSLFRVALTRSGSNAATVTEEFAEGVTDMQIKYLSKDSSGNLPVSYVDADSITDWTRVVAVRIVFTLQSLENVGTGATPLTRTWNTVITLRNRQL
jgi:type IV pilus assembly protein PilW